MQNVVIFVGIGGASLAIASVCFFIWVSTKKIPLEYKRINLFTLMSEKFLSTVREENRAKLGKVKSAGFLSLVIILIWLLSWGLVTFIWAKSQGV